MRAIVLLLLVFTVSLGALAQQRFDFKVREDMFAGMDGDTVAFDRAMKLIGDTLAREPDHAEALVWRGDGRLFMAGQAFQRGDFAGGQKLFTEGWPTWSARWRWRPTTSPCACRGHRACCPMRAGCVASIAAKPTG
jgi:hypothetical protein